jgi:hypothetical protein
MRYRYLGSSLRLARERFDRKCEVDRASGSNLKAIKD